MKQFNLTSYTSGRIVKTIQAQTIQQAKEILDNKGYDYQNNYFIESVEDSTKEWEQSLTRNIIEDIMLRAEENDNEYLFINYRH